MRTCFPRLRMASDSAAVTVSGQEASAISEGAVRTALPGKLPSQRTSPQGQLAPKMNTLNKLSREEPPKIDTLHGLPLELQRLVADHLDKLGDLRALGSVHPNLAEAVQEKMISLQKKATTERRYLVQRARCVGHMDKVWSEVKELPFAVGKNIMIILINTSKSTTKQKQSLILSEIEKHCMSNIANAPTEVEMVLAQISEARLPKKRPSGYPFP
jgi:hypothetical protein